MSATLISYGSYFMVISLLIGEMMLSSMLIDRVDKLTKRVEVIEHVLQKKIGRQGSGKSSDESFRELQRKEAKKVKETREAEYDT